MRQQVQGWTRGLGGAAHPGAAGLSRGPPERLGAGQDACGAMLRLTGKAGRTLSHDMSAILLPATRGDPSAPAALPCYPRALAPG